MSSVVSAIEILGLFIFLIGIFRASLVALLVKKLPTFKETRFQSMR